MIGNHEHEADLLSEEINDIDRSNEYSYTGRGPDNISHVFNYVLPIYESEENKTEIFHLWALDTGSNHCSGYYGYGCVEPDQIQWLKE